MKRVGIVVVLSALVAGCASEDWHGTMSSTSLRVDKLSSANWISGSNDVVGAKIEIEYERPVDAELAAFVDRHMAKSYMDAGGESVSGPGVNAVQDAFVKRYEESFMN